MNEKSVGEHPVRDASECIAPKAIAHRVRSYMVASDLNA